LSAFLAEKFSSHPDVFSIEMAYLDELEKMKISGRDSVTAIKEGTVGLSPPRSQCNTQSFTLSRIPVGGLFFRDTSLAPALTNLMPLDGAGGLDFIAMSFAIFGREFATLC